LGFKNKRKWQVAVRFERVRGREKIRKERKKKKERKKEEKK